MAYSKRKEIGDSGVEATYWAVVNGNCNFLTGRATVDLKGYLSEDKKKKEGKSFIKNANMGLDIIIPESAITEIKEVIYKALNESDNLFIVGREEEVDKDGKVIKEAIEPAVSC